MAIRLPFDFTLHWGSPRNDVCLRGDDGLRWRRGGIGSEWRGSYSVQRIEHWYGVSRGADWAIMFMRIKQRSSEEFTDGTRSDA